jgi:hypothetical protein
LFVLFNASIPYVGILAGEVGEGGDIAIFFEFVGEGGRKVSHSKMGVDNGSFLSKAA